MKTLTSSLCGVAGALMLAIPSGAAQGQKSAGQRIVLPGSAYEIVLDAGATRPGQAPRPTLIAGISAWLAFSFKLPPATQPPKFRFVSPEALLALRRTAVASDHASEPISSTSATGPSTQPEILALYDDALKTIYLRKDWSGHNAAGLSIVVHELVHHHQNLSGLKFACPQEREKTAFEAQDRWLGLFGSNLETAFGLDPFTILVRTNCPY